MLQFRQVRSFQHTARKLGLPSNPSSALSYRASARCQPILSTEDVVTLPARSDPFVTTITPPMDRVPSYWKDIGSTPLVKVSKGIYAKLEGHNPSASIKDRTIVPILWNLLKTHTGSEPIRLCLVSSGNASISLLKAHEHFVRDIGFNFQVIIVQPGAYADKVALTSLQPPNKFNSFGEFLGSPEATSTKSANHVFETGTFAEVLDKSKALAAEQGWVMVDQHHDQAGLQGHASSSEELLAACPGVTDVVCGTGTGATAAGLRKYLPDSVNVHSRPTDSGSIDGLCDVRRYNNFCDTTQLQGYNTSSVFDPAKAQECRKILMEDKGIRTGPSGGAAYYLATQIREQNKDVKVIIICADGKHEQLQEKLVEERAMNCRLNHTSTSHSPPLNRIPTTTACTFNHSAFSLSRGFANTRTRSMSYTRSMSTSRAMSTSTSTARATGGFSDRGIDYRQLEKGFSVDTLFEFNKTYGSTPHNFIPDGPVKEHLGKLSSGETVVWGAFKGEELVGFITGERGSGYWIETTHGRDATCFIHEFVVNPNHRGLGIGSNLTTLSVDAIDGIFGLDAQVREMYTTVHVGNVASRSAFIKGGYEEVMTYDDAARDRDTTVLKFAPRAKAPAMRVVGLQSGNAVDGLDVGVFDFEAAPLQAADPRALAAPLAYKVLANKTYPFTKEQRDYVLRLRAMRIEDGNEYAEANYKMGEWFADVVNDVLETENIDKSTVHIIGSHGQTVSGHPHWEFGDLSVIAQKTGITVAGDFRPADVAAGGNGTPVTCTYDSIMLRPTSGNKWRVAINIGGTASVTFLPPKGVDTPPLGLDPGLGVFFMDLTTKKIDPSLDFDDDGKMGRTGVTHEGLLEEFLTYKYYQQPNLPIGVGPDDFPETLFHKWYARAQELGVSDVDLLSTFVELTAKQIALACQRFGGEGVANGATDDILLRGGIVNNSYFMERLKAQMSLQLGVEVDRIKTLQDVGLCEESWENAMYAMMGYLCFNNLYNFVPSCTGASRYVVGGRIAPGENFRPALLSNLRPSSAPRRGFATGSNFVASNGLASTGLNRFAGVRDFSSSGEVPQRDYIIIGGGPVGGSAAWFLSEQVGEEKSILLIHDPTFKGAHEDWSRLARLSMDGPVEEYELSKHAIELLDLADEVRRFQSGAPVVPLRPGMLFVASPGTPMAEACAHSEANYGDPDFIRRDPAELEALFPGNEFNLPAETLCWTHPEGLCVSPLELAEVSRGLAEAQGTEIVAGRASVDMAPGSKDVIRVTLKTGEQYDTKKLFLYAGASGKQILAESLQRDPAGNGPLSIPEFDDTYISAISTVRYSHKNHPAEPAAGSGHVAPPITLGQLNVPDLCDFQANFSVVAEEYGDVLKCRLSGAVGSETVATVGDMHKMAQDSTSNDQMAKTYQNVFGSLFPYLQTEKPLDFNRCVTYRNLNSMFDGGTSLLEKKISDDCSVTTTPGCFGVGVKFGPALGEASTMNTLSQPLVPGMNVFRSGDPALKLGLSKKGPQRAYFSTQRRTLATQRPKASPMLLQCTGCKAMVDPSTTLGFSCPNSASQPHVDHILAPAPSSGPVVASFPMDGDVNPFVRYREFLFVYQMAMDQGMSDEAFIKVVRDLDDGLVAIGEPGFRETPLVRHEATDVWAKNETSTVAQSHKARHMFLVMIYLKVLQTCGSPASVGLSERPLAVASCGNAGLAAATVAKAANWPIDVYIPPSASPAVQSRLAELGARVHICERTEGEEGDPTVVAFRSAVANGSIALSVQGTDNGLAAEGSATIVWEALSAMMARGEDVNKLESVFVQVGGGALGAGMIEGLRLAVRMGVLSKMPTFNTVQARGCHPLNKAFVGVTKGQQANTPISPLQRAELLDASAQRRSELMMPWPEPHSVADGLLDDETYDWLKLVDGMLETNGEAMVVEDDLIERACELVRSECGVPVCHTGSVGMAGVLQAKPSGSSLVIFSGLNREQTA